MISVCFSPPTDGTSKHCLLIRNWLVWDNPKLTPSDILGPLRTAKMPANAGKRTQTHQTSYSADSSLPCRSACVFATPRCIRSTKIPLHQSKTYYPAIIPSHMPRPPYGGACIRIQCEHSRSNPSFSRPLSSSSSFSYLPSPGLS